MNLVLTIIVDGLIEASWLFIVALGLTLVFGVLKILNIAHGSFYALGAYVAATAVTMAAAKGLPALGKFCGHAARGRLRGIRGGADAGARSAENVLRPRTRWCCCW